jgi:hypothetical protein
MVFYVVQYCIVYSMLVWRWLLLHGSVSPTGETNGKGPKKRDSVTVRDT